MHPYSLDERLEQAGTDMTRVIESTVFLANIDDKAAMDAEWVKWCPDGCGVSRATVGAALAHGQLVVGRCKLGRCKLTLA